MAGAGKSTAARSLEDLGFFVIDNLPPMLIETLLNLSDSSGGELRRIALVIDAREAQFIGDFSPTWDRLKQQSEHEMTLLFLDCTDDVLVRRFKETRRRHPLDEGGGVAAGIARERELLRDVSHRADEIIHTEQLSVHELKRRIVDRFQEDADEARAQTLTIMSFGFKHGLPPEMDLCFDVRFLPNPYFVEGLRPQTGLDEPVASFVLEQQDANPFLDKVEDMVTFLLPRYRHEGKAYVTVAIGCTGGRHRSVALSEALAARLRAAGREVRTLHRDVERPV
jgi:UPF0042 nucleotide-binding protein